MTAMTDVKIDNLLITTRQQLDEHGHVRYSSDEFQSMSQDHVAAIQDAYGATALMRLPDHEVAFFEWLRVNDPAVWNDLWSDVADAPYLVSLQYLSDFAGAEAGGKFLIRDLQSVPNYYFTPEMVLEKESADFLAATRARLEDRASLTLGQAFALQASLGPMDLWHFAYEHGKSVDAVKTAVAALVEDRILVHVPTTEHLTDHFDVD